MATIPKQQGDNMNNSNKQLTVLNYLLIAKSKLTVGEAARLLALWEYKCGNVLNIKG